MSALKIFHNKNAEEYESGEKMVYYGIFFFLTAIVFIYIVSFVSSNRSEVAQIPFGVEDYLITQRFLGSPTCFAFQDSEVKRVYPWIIDLEKFSEANLNNCYSNSDTKVKAYRFTLSLGNDKTTINTKNWEGFLKKGETKFVPVYDKGNIKKGELFVEMQDAK